MARTPWYEEQLERAAWELDQLRAIGLSVEHEDREGVRVVRSTVDHGGEELRIVIRFPYEFPEEAPSIVSDRLVLERHQDRRGRSFCLLENPDADWTPRRSAAELVLLLQQLLRDDEAGAGAVTAGEADMPEPASAYYGYGDGVVLVPEPFLANDLAKDGGGATLAQNGSGTVLVLRKADGFVDAPKALVDWFASGGTRPAIWLAVDKPPDPANVDAAIGALLDERAPAAIQILRKRAKSSGRNRGASQLIGVTFLEEGPAVGEQRRTWVFFEVSIAAPTASAAVTRILRVQALSVEERRRRLPELEGLADVRALVIGAGSLGGAVAVELAKAGVGAVDIVDNDIYDVNNAVRHVVSARLAGASKVEAVAAACKEMNPFGDYDGHRFSVGSSVDASDKIEALVAAADIVIETTGGPSVARIIQNYCRGARTTLVVAALTAGSYGGEVIIVRPAGGCLDCFIEAQADKSIPEPAAGPAHRITPIGCRHPAFSGAGFDATTVAAEAVRSAVRVTGQVRYPPPDYDWAIINFRTEPRWLQGALPIHPRCHRSHG